MNENENERIFKAGTIGRCNRCNTKFVFSKDVRAYRENSNAWRVMDFAMSDCSHLDTHWVFESDNREAQQ